MPSPRRRGLIKRLQLAAQRLEEEAMLARHRLEIDNDQKRALLDIAGQMNNAASLLEKL